MIANKKLISILCSALAGSGSLIDAAPQDFELSTTGASGTLYLTNVNNESVEPNSGLPGSKNFDYPFYFDPGQGLYVMVVAEPLSAGYTYAFEEANFTVQNKTVTAANFGDFTFGNLSWDDTLLSGSGAETLGIGDFTLTLDGSPFSPINSPRNVNNEFAWDYTITPSNFSGPGLSFVDGQLSSIDLEADVAVLPRFGGTSPFGSSYDGKITFSNGLFGFDVDVTQDNTSFLGTLTDTHLVFDSSGQVLNLVPEPRTYALIAGCLTLAVAFCRRRACRGRYW